MTWTRESRSQIVVPVLPLDGHVLFPAASTPYRVSDPLHRQLVQDLVAKPADQRWLAVPPRGIKSALAEGALATDEGDGEHAALGMLTVATPLDGGEFIIVVEGRMVCRLETPPNGVHAPYRLARVRPLNDRPESLAAARTATTALVQALFSLYDCFGLAAADLPVGDGTPLDDAGLVYRVAHAVIQDPAQRAQLLAERCPARRRAIVLEVIADQLAFAFRERLLGRAPAGA